MKTVSFQYQTKLNFSLPVTEHYFVLRILPQSDERQRIKKISVSVDPKAITWNSTDGFSNNILSGNIDYPHDYFNFGIQGTAEVADVQYTLCREPERILLYHSELTKPGEKLENLYKQIESSAPGDTLKRAQHFSGVIHERMRYERGVTNNSTTAEEAFLKGAGVCQDYAHILLSLLRQDGILCRYVAGLASDYGETHAWAEVWVADRYWGIDPTRNKLIDESYIAMSRGRDFEDASVERGVYKGMCSETKSIKLDMITSASEILQ